MHALVLKEITGISHKSQVGLFDQNNDKLVFRIKFGFGGGIKGENLVLSSPLISVEILLDLIFELTPSPNLRKVLHTSCLEILPQH